MTLPRYAALGIAALAILLLAACGDDEKAAVTSPAATNNAAPSICDAFEAEIDSYADGMSKAGDAMVVTVTADPGPPDLGLNTWVVQLEDGSGNPVETDAIRIAPFMPGHGHGTNPLTYDGEATGEAGTWMVGPFDLFMPGVWEFTITVERAGAEPTSTLFRLCIEG